MPSGFRTTFSKSNVVVLGASVMDLVAYCPRMPKVGETVLGSDFKMGFGGKGANQAVMAGILGGKTAMISKINPSDSFGRDMISNFASHGVDVDHVFTTDKDPTGAAAIHVDAGGHNQIAVVMGANNSITIDEVKKATAIIKEAKLLVVQLEIPLEITLAAMRIARSVGTKTFLNTAPARNDLPPEIFQLADIICPNEPETELLTGLKVETVEDAKKAARCLIQKGCKTVILTLGSRGAMLVDAEHKDGLLIETTKVKALDTVGAGDCFVGAFSHFFTEGLPISKAIQRACKVASLSVMKPGTQSSYPSVEECKTAGVFV